MLIFVHVVLSNPNCNGSGSVDSVMNVMWSICDEWISGKLTLLEKDEKERDFSRVM